jgi:hypothetical protein
MTCAKLTPRFRRVIGRIFSIARFTLLGEIPSFTVQQQPMASRAADCASAGVLCTVVISPSLAGSSMIAGQRSTRQINRVFGFVRQMRAATFHLCDACVRIGGTLPFVPAIAQTRRDRSQNVCGMIVQDYADGALRGIPRVECSCAMMCILLDNYTHSGARTAGREEHGLEDLPGRVRVTPHSSSNDHRSGELPVILGLGPSDRRNRLIPVSLPRPGNLAKPTRRRLRTGGSAPLTIPEVGVSRQVRTAISTNYITQRSFYSSATDAEGCSYRQIEAIRRRPRLTLFAQKGASRDPGFDPDASRRHGPRAGPLCKGCFGIPWLTASIPAAPGWDWKGRCRARKAGALRQKAP